MKPNSGRADLAGISSFEETCASIEDNWGLRHGESVLRSRRGAGEVLVGVLCAERQQNKVAAW